MTYAFFPSLLILLPLILRFHVLFLIYLNRLPPILFIYPLAFLLFS
jgi:hypothetical protein